MHGFANHVPLAVALRQILPPGYGFSVDQDVDLGVMVSFHGGKPWRDTLNDALAPAGLIVHEQGQMVEIGYPAGRDLVSAPGGKVPLAPKPKLATPIHFSDSPTERAPMPSLPPAPTLATTAAAETAIGDLPPPEQSWDAQPGDSLRKVLQTWSKRANIEFDWMAEYDYPLQASTHFTGTFEDAVRNLLTGFETAHPQPIAELHSNPKAGQMVLVVTTRGNTTD